MERLSSVNPIKAFFMNEEAINKYVFRPNRVDIKDGDHFKVGLVLGCGNYSVMTTRLASATELYHNGVFEKFLLTGGVGFLSLNRKEPEAEVMRKHLLKEGIPDSDIEVENRSRDTYENMKNSLKTIVESSSDKKLILITSDFHQKRAKGMLQKMTDLEIYSYGTLDGINDMDTWSKSLLAQKNIRTEAALLSWYTKRGIIDDEEIAPVYVKTR